MLDVTERLTWHSKSEPKTQGEEAKPKPFPNKVIKLTFTGTIRRRMIATVHVAREELLDLGSLQSKIHFFFFFFFFFLIKSGKKYIFSLLTICFVATENLMVARRDLSGNKKKRKRRRRNKKILPRESLDKNEFCANKVDTKHNHHILLLQKNKTINNLYICITPNCEWSNELEE